ncbi:hypothetical protein JKF63_02478 [Porcisia hertigi]|uniref:Uncharacterized protein n=1 Tax=Porcisia hertigi TaxID=2761500 RepID=A0A836L3U6_9TRYP|nr:hypothetical protein JKF63_02478 [Porcisia hertigi]
MSLSVVSAENHANESWGFYIHDAVTPPTLTATTIWLFLSSTVAILFLEVRPAAIRRVRGWSVHGERANGYNVGRYADGNGVWRLIAAVWTCALYDAVHRTCCYGVLSVHMLARRQLLPLGNQFVWDGLWTEWVNWVRLHVFCWFSVTSSTAAPPNSCEGWQLPLAGILAYDQYPEYATLNVSSPATPREVGLYRAVCVASLAITCAAVVAIHQQYTLVSRIFCRMFPSRWPRHPDVAIEKPTGSEERDKRRPIDITTALATAEAPGDDSWVNSPEAMEEEERWRQEKEQTRHKRGVSPDVGVAAGVASLSLSLSLSHALRQTWPSLATAVYVTLYALVGGLPVFMHLLFPAASVVVSVMAMVATV